MTAIRTKRNGLKFGDDFAHQYFFRYLQQLTGRFSRPPRFEDAAFENMFENVNKSRRPSTSLAQPSQPKAATEAFHDGRPKREICFAADVLSQHQTLLHCFLKSNRI